MLNFTIQDMIDILLTAFLLYYIYRLMKASRSGRIFTGIIIFLIVWLLVSQVLEMKLMSRIMNQVMNLGGLALIILFQEEIRSFFFQIGSGRKSSRLLRFFTIRRTEEQTDAEVIPLVMACMNMGRQKTGALIILERGVSLLDVIRTGEVINADLNQRLIENIFFKNSPLHDGAVVVGGKRIKAAGCILPVSHDENIPKHLGLRHRAALGISQVTDCIAIIVSEETGAISVAKNREFLLRLTNDELEKLLREEWRK